MEYCKICGNNKLSKTKYFYKTKENIFRKMLYKLPLDYLRKSAKIYNLNSIIRLKEIIFNRETFSGNKLYCSSCKTGWHSPVISEEKLDNYYKSFYWLHRSNKEKIYDFKDKIKPDNLRLNYVRDQYSFIKTNCIQFKSVIDFGAGDCSGGYFFKKILNKKDVSIFDPSDSARKLAKIYDLKIIEKLPINKVDLIYSSHSIEHISDIKKTLKSIKDALNDKGYIFLETPNISSEEVFLNLIHTPHTYMFSIDSFKNIAINYGFKIIGIKSSGPLWNKDFKSLKDSSRADLRICMQKL